MKFFLIAMFAGLSAAAPHLGPPVPALIRAKGTRIVEGEEATPGQFPFQGSLLVSSDPESMHSCGAVYIGGTWVLCAAHCTQSG